MAFTINYYYQVHFSWKVCNISTLYLQYTVCTYTIFLAHARYLENVTKLWKKTKKFFHYFFLTKEGVSTVSI